MWQVDYTDEFRSWFDSLENEKAVASIRAAVRVLRDEGPTLGRPLVDTVENSAYANMKELRPLGTSIRILFAFDPRRAAILLVGGDKAGEWNAWYVEHIPIADTIYAEHIRTLEMEMEAAAKVQRQGKRHTRGSKGGKGQ